MVFTSWSRMSREQRKVWSFVAGAIVAGSVFKVAYFTFSRRLVVSDHERRQQERLEHLRKAEAFAVWSRQDREAKLPPLTPEQREQVREYLGLVERHGLRRVVEQHQRRANDDDDEKGGGSSNNNNSDEDNDDDDDCVGCPAFRHVTRKSTSVAPSRSWSPP